MSPPSDHYNTATVSQRALQVAVVRIGTFRFGGLVVGQFITDQTEQ